MQTASRTGSDVRELAERASAPVYAPDGDRIAFVTDRDEHGLHATGSDENAFANELYAMDSDGGDAQRLTDTDELDEGSPESRGAFTLIGDSLAVRRPEEDG